MCLLGGERGQPVQQVQGREGTPGQRNSQALLVQAWGWEVGRGGTDQLDVLPCQLCTMSGGLCGQLVRVEQSPKVLNGRAKADRLPREEGSHCSTLCGLIAPVRKQRAQLLACLRR